MFRTVALLSLTLTATSGLANHAFAQSWQICNKTSESIDVAIGYAVTGGLLQSEGWWTLAPSGCARVLNQGDTVDLTTGYLYARTANGGRPVVEGDLNICVNNRPFTIRRNQNCEGRNFKTVQSRQVGINLNRNFTTNVTGPSQPKIDD
jgi:uncharacterized membrane protein